MRVCIEISALNSRFAGIAYYTWFLSKYIVEQSDQFELQGFDGVNFHPLSSAYLDELRERNENLGGMSQIVGRARLYEVARRIPFARSAYRRVKSHRFARRIEQIELFHAINYLAPSIGFKHTLPLIHDISHERHPETHPQERVDWLRRGLKMLDRHPVINTVSEFSADEIATFYGIDRKRIHVTYPGINPAYHLADEAADRAVMEEFALTPFSFFVVVGTLEPRKNLKTVLKAFRQLPKARRVAHPLVLIGQPGWGDDGLSQTKDLVSEGSMKILGYQSDRRLAALYRNARTLLFPSIYEGFGIPTTEALASGKRPILSDIPVMREVGGEAADYVMPLDSEAWATALDAAIDYSRHENGDFRSKSIDWAARYDWAVNARQTLGLYREARDAFAS